MKKTKPVLRKNSGSSIERHYNRKHQLEFLDLHVLMQGTKSVKFPTRVALEIVSHLLRPKQKEAGPYLQTKMRLMIERNQR